VLRRRPAPPPDEIDVRDLIRSTSVEDLCRTADAVYAQMPNWDDLFAKPFGSVRETPGLLNRLGTLLGGLQLAPGMSVLEFGCGSGWLSRALTQLGCEVIAADVAPTALRLGEELYRRLPPVGNCPSPRFLRFDGHRLDLPDDSVERVVCFDAFHHVPNPSEALAELGRVLRPGGIAGFAEPGPNHSRGQQSQFEMRHFRTVENDIVVQDIWEAARRAGFTDLRLAFSSARSRCSCRWSSSRRTCKRGGAGPWTG
jgi:SAM-dependent methyltransferase